MCVGLLAAITGWEPTLGNGCPLRGAATLRDLVHPWSSFPKEMETRAGHCCHPELGLGLSCFQLVLGLWAVIAMDYVSELVLG